MRKGVLLFILFLALSNCFSQVSFSGKIVDEKSVVVPGAIVALLNMNVTAITNAQGQFTLTAFPGTYWLYVSATGYAAITQQVNISKESSVLTISLQPSFVRLDEVVVSAEKKEELLQTLPLSITALTSRQVKEYRLWNIQELTAIAPTFYSADPGDKRNVSSIRGVTTTSYDPAIATYVDGVNQFNLDTYIPHLFDVERIEVLRGPQGTLYGRNAMGGVVNIITKQPTNYTNGFAEINIGDHNQQRYIASIRTPLIKDKLFLGIAGMYDKMNGFYTNDFDNSHFDKQSSTAGNFYLKFLPSADWAVTLNVKQVFNRNNGPFSLVFGADEALKNPFHLNQNATTKLIDNVANYSLAINHTGRMINFSSQTSYQSNYRYYEAPIDGDFSPIDGVTIINNYGKNWNNVKAVTQEFKFTSPASSVSPLQWTAGTYLFYQNSPNKQATHFGEDALLLGAPDKNFSLINTTKAEGRGIAFYGQATYTLNKAWDITAGIRYDYEHKQQSVLGEY
ncbi:MAG TPA: TonB-dependent receptor, partial [Chitinophagaceae bacterium]